MSKEFLKGMFTVVAVAALVLFVGWKAASAYSYHDHELVGTWKVTVQLNNCNGVLIGGPFSSLLTFAEGETMIEDTMNPGFAVGQRGTGHGVWQTQGWRKYGAKSIAFINFTTPPTVAPPSPGFKQGTQTITQTIEFTDGPDSWTTEGNAQVEFADTTGTVYRSACATATAQRLE